MVDSSKWEIIEAGLKCYKAGRRQLHQPQRRRRKVHRNKRELVRRYGAAVIVMAFDEHGQADTLQRKIEVCARAYKILTEQVGFPPQEIIFDPNILDGRHGHRRAQ